jgi:lysophospholipase L1-like esterase
LLVGDSLAVGLATPIRQLALGASVAFAADGRIGTRLDQWAKSTWLKAALTPLSPTVVLVSLGTNDMGLPNPELQRPYLATILATIRSYGAEPVWIGPPTMPFADRGIRSMLDNAGMALFHSDSVAIPRAGDGIHPTAAGYAGWAGLLWKWTDTAAQALPNGLSGVAMRRAGPARHRVRVDRRRRIVSPGLR